MWGRLRGWSFLRLVPNHAARQAVADALEAAHATGFAERPYAELSEGQKQRVLFARMLASEAELALLDEPTAAMDPVSERDAYRRLAELAHAGRAVVVVSHALGPALRFADDLLWLDREGPHVVHGPPAEVVAHAGFRAQYGVIAGSLEALA
jgi:zinc transport system ATP-binding protein